LDLLKELYLKLNKVKINNDNIKNTKVKKKYIKKDSKIVNKTVNKIINKIDTINKKDNEFIIKINLDIERIKQILSLLTWMFDIFMKFPDTITSDIIMINNNSSIKNIKDLIYSDIIVDECKNYILTKYKI
jgi:hypothetical protein